MKLQEIVYPNVTLNFTFVKKGKTLNYSVFLQLNDPYIEEITIDRVKCQFITEGYEFISVHKVLEL